MARADGRRESEGRIVIALASFVCRAFVVAFWGASAAYAFLISVPFVYEQFLQPELVPALASFARWHGLLSIGAAVLTVGALWPDLARRQAFAAGGALIWITILAAVAAAVASPMTTLSPGAGAAAVSAAALVPIIWLAAVDLSLAPWPDLDRSNDGAGRDLAVVGVTAFASATLFGGVGLTYASGLTGHGATMSAAAHALFFAAVFAAFAIVRAFADLTSKPSQWETFGGLVVLVAMTGMAAVLVILPALSQRDPVSRVVVFAFGATLGFSLGARGIRTHAVPERDGITTVFGGVLPGWARRDGWRPRLAWATLVVGVAVASRVASSGMDWNFVVAKLGAVTVWLLILSAATVWTRRPVTVPAFAPYACCVALLALHLAATGRGPLSPVSVEAAAQAGDGWAIGDPSYRTLRDWLHTPAPDASTGEVDGPPLFDYLQAHTNIARSTDVAPVPVRLADLDAPRPARRPHVFLFVVDSLRKDYLSPYNPAVTFTPSIQRFAADSTVFTRTFTRYGATGLSVPSIWVGGMVLHKQYVTPFAPMNALHALLGTHGYARWMSMDNIVDIIMPRDDSLDEIDRQRSVADFRFCASLDDLRSRLDRLAASDTPTFVWSLPQDIHVAAITREGKNAVDDASYEGFDAPYASRVRRFDECFGQFVDDLKARQLYDESLIVVTSDHGDSLGEEGRFGHAYTVFPEVIQVPLLMHLPVGARAAVETDPSALSFTTDITPTIYALLGHDVRPESPIFGRPLVWPRGQTPPARPPFGLVASSYGSVYAWIDERGEQMYIADGVNLRDYVYALDGSAAGVTRPVTSEARAAGQHAIRDGVQAIAEFYRFQPPTP
jgi:Sulfatase